MRALLAENRSSVGETQVGWDVDGVSASGLELIPPQRQYAEAPFSGELRVGTHVVTLRPSTADALDYRLVASYAVPWSDTAAEPDARLALTVASDRTELPAGELLRLDAAITWRSSEAARVPVVEIGVPPSTDVVTADLDAMQDRGVIEKWGRTDRHVVLYLPILQGTQQLSFRVRCRYPGKMSLPPSRAYAHDAPDAWAEVLPVQLTVR